MENNEFCYVIVYDDFPLWSLDGNLWSNIVGVYHNVENAVERVKEYADVITADYGDGHEPVKVVYDGPSDNWPWLFTWEECDRQKTYKVIPKRYKD